MRRVFPYFLILLVIAGWSVAYYYRTLALGLEADTRMLVRDRDDMRRHSWTRKKPKNDDGEAEPTNAPTLFSVGEDMTNGFLAVLNDPRSFELYDHIYRAQVKRNYGELFKKLHLPPDQQQKLEDLLVKRQNTATDAALAAMSQGLNPLQDLEEFRRIQTDTLSKVDGEVSSLLGSVNFQDYSQYMSSEPERTVVNQLRQTLAYTSHPLSMNQAAQLQNLLSLNTMTAGQSGTPSSLILNNQDIAQTQKILSPKQYTELLGMKAEQEASAGLAEMMKKAQKQSSSKIRKAASNQK